MRNVPRRSSGKGRTTSTMSDTTSICGRERECVYERERVCVYERESVCVCV